MKLLYLILTKLLLVSFLTAQEQDSSNFIQLNTNEKKFGKVEFKDPFLSRSYLLLDDTIRIELKDIRAFQNSDGYFARVPNSTMILKRVREGKVDLFSKTVSHYTMGNTYFFSTPGGMVTNTTPGYFSTTTIEYFSKDDLPVEEASYSSLRKALADNTESMRILDEYRTLNYYKYGFLVGGLAIVVAGLASKDGPDKGLLIGGAVVANISWIPTLMQGGKFSAAINAYNR